MLETSQGTPSDTKGTGVGDRAALPWHRVAFICPGVFPQQWVSIAPAAVLRKGTTWGRGSLFPKEMAFGSIGEGWGSQGWL